ncbi:MAG: peptidase T [Spirochaetales bacterium]|nr:peptidase T [Spirochaetales bacterium]
MIKFNDSVRDRFIRYTTYDTMSDGNASGNRRPTTEGQEELLLVLKKELEELGLETYYGEEKVVMGVLKGNSSGTTIGFMAHVDTADDCNGNGVKAKVWSNYDGGVIELEDGVVLDPEKDKDLLLYKGKEIITSDGTSLLGSDDKAGVAIIMEALKYLVEHPEVKRPDIEVYFTPDEETGSGMDMFPYDRLKSKCCYTVDGEAEGEVELECFNAATVEILLKGVSIHLGSARGTMVNAVTMASHIVTSLPQAESPEATDGRYGYYCPLVLEGTATEAKLSVFIRDFDMEKFQHRIESVEKIVAAVEALYGGEIKANVSVSYHNMAEANKKNPGAIEAVYSASQKLGLAIREEIIRGGTDGARLAETGVACPNLYTGGHNLHSLKEWIAVDAMSNSINLCLGIIDYWSKR